MRTIIKPSKKGLIIHLFFIIFLIWALTGTHKSIHVFTAGVIFGFVYLMMVLCGGFTGYDYEYIINTQGLSKNTYGSKSTSLRWRNFKPDQIKVEKWFIIGQLFNFGDLVFFDGSGNKVMEWKNVSDPESIKRMILDRYFQS